MKSIQLCHMDPVDRATGKFSVTAHSDEEHMRVDFACSSERSARMLRDAIREHADKVSNVLDARERPRRRVQPLSDTEVAAVYSADAEDGWCGHDLSDDSLKAIFARICKMRGWEVTP